MIGRDSSSTPGWSWRLFSFSTFLLIVSAVAYLGLEFGYSPFLKSQITKVDASLEQIEQEVPAADQESFINFYSQVLHIEDILNDHTFFSPLFSLIEQNIQSNTFLTSLEYEAAENRVSLEGISASFKDLGEQLQRIDAIEEVERALVSESRAADGGGVYFRIVIYPDKDIFRAENTPTTATIEQGSVEEEQPEAVEQIEE